MSNSTLPPPPYQSAVVGPDQRINLSWSDWIKQLYVRVGQAVAPVNGSASATLTGYVGAGGIAETAFSIANNVSSPADVTGLKFSTSVLSAEIEIQFYRNTTGVGATEYSSRGKYLATYKPVAASWDLAPLGVGGDMATATDGSTQPAGVLISITSLGQIQYTSSNMTGTSATSKMHFIAKTMANP